jgi:signal transduction histidine kinase
MARASTRPPPPLGLPAQLAAGLGLVGMRERVDRLGGSLIIESTPRAGTTVVVTLPA